MSPANAAPAKNAISIMQIARVWLFFMVYPRFDSLLNLPSHYGSKVDANCYVGSKVVRLSPQILPARANGLVFVGAVVVSLYENRAACWFTNQRSAPET